MPKKTHFVRSSCVYYILNYFDHALYIDLQSISDEKHFLEEVHRKTAHILPQLDFTDFTFEVVYKSSPANEDKNELFHYLIVSLNSNGRQYLHESGPLDPKDKRSLPLHYYQIFNKILVDIQSPYKIHLVYDYKTEKQGLWLIAMTEEQDDLTSLYLGGNERVAYLWVSAESDPLPTKQIDEAIRKYDSLELFKHLTQKEIADAKRQVAAQINTDLIDILNVFPKILYSIEPVAYEVEEGYRYIELLSSFPLSHIINLILSFLILQHMKRMLRCMKKRQT